jgi:hypothetical protein
VGGTSGCQERAAVRNEDDPMSKGSCRERQLAIMQLSEADTRGMDAVFVEHTGCAADIGVVDGRKDVEGVSYARARRGGLASSQGSGWG